MKLRPKTTFSLKTLIIGFICFGFTILLAATYVIRTNFLRQIRQEALNQVGSQLLASGNVQVEEILPGLLLKEEHGALDYVLQRIQEKEQLLAIRFEKDAKNAFVGSCSETSLRSSVCFDLGTSLVRTIHRAEMDGEVFGYLTKDKTVTHLGGAEIEKSFLIIFLVLGVVLVGLVLWVAYFLERYVRRPMLSLEDILKPALSGDGSKVALSKNRVTEIHGIFEQVQMLISKYQNSRTQAALGRFATQIGHDLITRITSLRMTVEGVDGLGRTQMTKLKGEVEHIRKIATTLREKQKLMLVDSADSMLSPEEIEPQLLAPLIEQVIIEKRKLGSTVRFKSSSDELSAKIQAIEFQRVLSNVIDNSIEAMEPNSAVTLQLEERDGTAILSIRDKGRGVPKNVLPKLMKPRASFGKKNGLGSGLYHAKVAIEAWEGKISLTSKEGRGTEVVIELPAIKTGPDYVTELKVEHETEVIVIDDSSIIGDFWKRSLEGIVSDLKYFSSTRKCEEWMKSNSPSQRPRLYLVDMDITGSEIDGLTLIERTGIAKDSILVTGSYDDEDVMRRCRELGVRLLPKTSQCDLIIRDDSHARASKGKLRRPA